MDLQTLSSTMPSPTLTDPDLILPDEAAWLPASSLSQFTQQYPSYSRIQEHGQSAMPGVARSHTLRWNTPSLFSINEIDAVPQDRPYRRVTLPSFPTLRDESQPKKSREVVTHVEGLASDEDISIRSEDLEDIKWSELDSASIGGSSIYSAEDALEVGNNVSGAASTDHGKRRSLERGTEEDEETSSHAAMSKRAELILANAKRKLNLMEDNLRRTHRSFVGTSRSSLWSLRTTSSSGEEVSTPVSASAEGPIYLSFSFPRPKQRLFHSRSHSSLGSAGHLRVVSESPMSSAGFSYLSRPNIVAYDQRLSNVNGNSHEDENVGSVSQRRVVRASRSEESMLRNRYANQFPSHRVSADLDGLAIAGLTPLKEDDRTVGDDPVSQIFRLRRSSRTKSMTQTNDLREQMKELQGRILNLQKRAREDGLKRRSLQNLRQATPLAAAETWESGAQATDARESAKNGQMRDTGQVERSERRFALNHTNNGAADLQNTTASARRDANSPASINHSEEFDNESVYEETLEHKALPAVEERHEDRADAFDYGTSFLHSGMGSYSRQSNKRRGSTSSIESAETAQGPGIFPDRHSHESQDVRQQHDAARSDLHFRSESVASVSTLASFTTAVSGYDSVRRSGETSRGDIDGELADETSYRTSRPLLPDDLFAASTRMDSAQSNYSSTSDVPTPTLASFPLSTKLTSEAAHNPRPASALLSLLVGSASKTTLMAALSSQDKELVYALAESLQQVCVQLQHNVDDPFGTRIWRRRLDEARRVLEGEDAKALGGQKQEQEDL